MSVCLENLNLDFFNESEERCTALIGAALSEGELIVGYHGLPYVNKLFGDAQIVLSAVKGTVKKMICGTHQYQEEEVNAYVISIIDTEYGELEIVHTVEQVSEELRENMKPGATVFMIGVLSGDVAIYEYEKGVVYDEENDLAAMRYMFSGNDPDRIRSILSEDILYRGGNGREFRGIDAVIAKLKTVQEENDGAYFAHRAVISEIKDGEEALEYPVDTKCLVLTNGGKTNYESIVFFDYDQDFKIKRILVSTNPGYRFTIQTPIDESVE